jgi:membrane associated rhomboid family serine protease
LVVLGYLLSGLLGAFVFTRLTGLTASPLVGASASISGLGALTAFHLRRERIPFFYLIFPQPGYMGLASFPAWTILLLFTIPDLAGYLSSVSDVSSVAYAAHLGGGLCGALLAGLLHLGWLAPDPYDPDLGWQLFEN